MASIGFIGLGHMGLPMAQHLLDAGHDLIVFDLNERAMSTLCQHGATAARGIPALAQHADFIFTMLQNGEQVSSICLGEQGLFSQAKPGTYYIDCSSIDVESARTLHQAAKRANIKMLDAPVSGGVSGAEKASLTFMVGGDEAILTEVKPILSLMGKNIIHAGEAGNGQVAKICNNMILGVSMIAVSEAFSLGEKLGLSPEKLFAIASQSSGQCWAMTSYAPVPNVVPSSPANRDFQPGFTANMMLKDLRLSQAAAEQADALTPLGEDAMLMYEKFVEQGYGELDFSGIIKLFG